MNSVWRRAAAGLAAAAAGACGEDTPTPPPGPGAVVVARAEVWAADSAVLAGRTLQLRLTAWDSSGQVVTPTGVAWQTGDTTKATVDATGIATTRSGGDVDLWAITEPLGVADTLRLHVAVEGEVRWSWAIPTGEMPDIAGPALGPDGTVYALTHPYGIDSNISNLVALSARGQYRWGMRLDRTHSDQVTVGPDGTAYVTGSTVRAISPEGQLRWTHALQGSLFPIFKHGALATSGLLVVAGGHSVIALSIATGDTIWHGPISTGSAWSVPPTIAGSTVWAKRSGDSLYAFDLATGALGRRIPDLDVDLDRTAFGNGPVAVGATVFIPTRNRVQAVDTSGPLRWLTPSGGSGVAEPVIDGYGRVFVVVQKGLAELDAASGAQLWIRSQCKNGPMWHGGPALTAGGAIVCSGLDGVFAFNRAGDLLWSFQTTEGGSAFVQFRGAPAIGPDGTIYTWSVKRIYALWGRDPPDPASPWPMWRHDAQRTGRAW